jgi:hypothetical protein
VRFVADLAAVLIRPRRTMARILDASPRNIHVWLLFALGAVSGIFGDIDPALLRRIEESGGMQVAIIIAAVLAAMIVLWPLAMWFYSYVPLIVGKLLGGTGDIRDVRAAIAWGFAPVVWALLYRIPATFLLTPSAETSVRMGKGSISFDPGRIADGCGILLILALLEGLVAIAFVFVTSNTLAESHRFSAWRGLGTIVISAIVPLVVIAAAVLAIF